MFSLLLFATVIAGALAHTCTTTGSNIECNDLEYCCDNGCCESTGFAVPIALCVIGAVPLTVLTIALAITMVRSLCKPAKKEVSPSELDATSLKSTAFTETKVDVSNEENSDQATEAQPKQEKPKPPTPVKKDPVHKIEIKTEHVDSSET